MTGFRHRQCVRQRTTLSYDDRRRALGLPLGIFLAALVTRALGRYDIRFALPVGQLVVFATVAVAAGLLAAITPARRAAKLDPLRALQYE